MKKEYLMPFFLKRDNFMPALICGIFLGILVFFSPGSLFMLLLAGGVFWAIRYYSFGEERVFLSRIFISALCLRLILVLLLQFILIKNGRFYDGDVGNRSTILLGDDATNTVVAWYYTRFFSGLTLAPGSLSTVTSLGSFGDYAISGYLYLLGAFYYLFGYSPVAVIFLNCIIGALTGIIYYSIAKEACAPGAAKAVGAITAFFPSLVFWSTANLKEPLFIFLSGLILWLFQRLLRGRVAFYSILIFLALLFQFTLRTWVFLPTLLILCAGYVTVKIKKWPAILIFCVIVFLAAAILFKARLELILGKLVDYHLGVYFTGGSVYRIYDSWVYNPGGVKGGISLFVMLKALMRGWAHMLFEPFIWRRLTFSSLVVLPQLIIWYLLTVFCFIGIGAQLRYRFKESVTLVLYFFIMGSVIALTAGNVGTVFRFRDMLTPLAALFAVSGFLNVFANNNTGFALSAGKS